MNEITTEAEWLACNDPLPLGRYASGKINPQRFRWLAVEWGLRINYLFNSVDRVWFEAFAAWVAGQGKHPSQLTLPQELEYSYMPHHTSLTNAESCGESIRQNDYLRAAAFAARSFCTCTWPRPLEKSELPYPHGIKAKHKQAANRAKEDAHQQTWQDEKQRCCQEFCNQFRDVAGNPFRPVQVRAEWLTSTVMELAHCIHTDQAFSDMSILSDALQDAGCDHSQILDHCRSVEPHVRGCWVLSLLMGEERQYS